MAGHLSAEEQNVLQTIMVKAEEVATLQAQAQALAQQQAQQLLQQQQQLSPSLPPPANGGTS